MHEGHVHQHERDLSSIVTAPRVLRAASAALLIASLATSLDAAAGPERAAPFRREWLEPYLRSGAGAQARLHLQARAPHKAIPLLRRLVHGSEGLQARYLLAHALLQSGQPGPAAALFDELAGDYPLLVDYCRFHGAQARFRDHDFAGAAALAARVPAGSVLHLEAQLIRADALRMLKQWKELPGLWGEYLRKYPRGGRAGQAHLRIGNALEQQAGAVAAGAERDKLVGEALEHYRQAVIRAPLSSIVVEARQSLMAAAAMLEDGSKRAELGGWDRFEQAQAYFRAQRNTDAEAAFAAILRGKDLSPLLRCKTTFYQATSIFKQRQRARAAPLYDQAVDLCRKTGENELVVKSLFFAAKGLMQAKQPKDAIARLEQLEKEFPSHSYADDARLWEAEAYDTLKEPAESARVLSALPRLYPRGDMVHEALWRLARAAYLDKKLDAALGWLDQAVAIGRARYYYSAGQALYWKARILEQTGKLKEASSSYERCIREYPLSYYALLAFNRLRERNASLYRKLQRELLAPAGLDKGRWAFAPSALYEEPGFRRGVELARLGFANAARDELTAVGLSTRAGTSSNNFWLAAVLYDRAGLWQLSHQVPRDADPELRRSYPLADAWRRWALAYPLAYPQHVRAAAGRAHVPDELVLAIMREESGFDPGIESYANAIGLMQLILPTARAAGRLQKVTVTREVVRDPVQNIRLGATFLGFLVSTFARQLPLAIAGYNAGEGAVFRWLSQFGNAPLDEFIERIPYDQTRRYTKRVLSTIFTYAVLYKRGEARVPKLAQRIVKVSPKAFGSK